MSIEDIAALEAVLADPSISDMVKNTVKAQLKELQKSFEYKKGDILYNTQTYRTLDEIGIKLEVEKEVPAGSTLEDTVQVLTVDKKIGGMMRIMENIPLKYVSRKKPKTHNKFDAILFPIFQELGKKITDFTEASFIKQVGKYFKRKNSYLLLKSDPKKKIIVFGFPDTKADAMTTLYQMAVLKYTRKLPASDLSLEQYAIRTFLSEAGSEFTVMGALQVFEESYRGQWEKERDKKDVVTEFDAPKAIAIIKERLKQLKKEYGYDPQRSLDLMTYKIAAQRNDPDPVWLYNYVRPSWATHHTMESLNKQGYDGMLDFIVRAVKLNNSVNKLSKKRIKEIVGQSLEQLEVAAQANNLDIQKVYDLVTGEASYPKEVDWVQLHVKARPPAYPEDFFQTHGYKGYDDFLRREVLRPASKKAPFKENDWVQWDEGGNPEYGYIIAFDENKINASIHGHSLKLIPVADLKLQESYEDYQKRTGTSFEEIDQLAKEGYLVEGSFYVVNGAEFVKRKINDTSRAASDAKFLLAKALENKFEKDYEKSFDKEKDAWLLNVPVTDEIIAKIRRIDEMRGSEFTDAEYREMYLYSSNDEQPKTNPPTLPPIDLKENVVIDTIPRPVGATNTTQKPKNRKVKEIDKAILDKERVPKFEVGDTAYFYDGRGATNEGEELEVLEVEVYKRYVTYKVRAVDSGSVYYTSFKNLLKQPPELPNRKQAKKRKMKVIINKLKKPFQATIIKYYTDGSIQQKHELITIHEKENEYYSYASADKLGKENAYAVGGLGILCQYILEGKHNIFTKKDLAQEGRLFSWYDEKIKAYLKKNSKTKVVFENKKCPSSKWVTIGVNGEGKKLMKDKNGVRRVESKQGIFETEKVGINISDTGVGIEQKEREDKFKVVEETSTSKTNPQPATGSPATNDQGVVTNPTKIELYKDKEITLIGKYAQLGDKVYVGWSFDKRTEEANGKGSPVSKNSAGFVSVELAKHHIVHQATLFIYQLSERGQVTQSKAKKIYKQLATHSTVLGFSQEMIDELLEDIKYDVQDFAEDNSAGEEQQKIIDIYEDLNDGIELTTPVELVVYLQKLTQAYEDTPYRMLNYKDLYYYLTYALLLWAKHGKAGSTSNPNPQPATGSPATGSPATRNSQPVHPITNAALQHFQTKKRIDKRVIKKLAAQYSITDLDYAYEKVELAWVLHYRSILQQVDGDIKDQYRAVIDFYENHQPTFSQTSSTKKIFQQYSTPAPVAVLAGYFAEADEAESVFEPSAGNGLMTIYAPYKKTMVNELDPTRLENLKTQPFKMVTDLDASKPFKGYKKTQDAVLSNPPFGRLETRNYDYNGFLIKKLDHIMIAHALDTMEDAGRAALIIGGHNKVDPKTKRIQTFRPFFNWLYRHYYVMDIININSRVMYRKQGTAYPVRLILVAGRKLAPTGHSPTQQEDPKIFKEANTWEALLERVETAKEKAKIKPVTRSEELAEVVEMLKVEVG